VKRKGGVARRSSERSVEQNCGSMNKNRLQRRQGWRSGQKTANSRLIKARKRKVGDRARKARWGDPRQEVSFARSSDEGVETRWSEGAIGAADCSRVKGDGQVRPAYAYLRNACFANAIDRAVSTRVLAPWQNHR